MPKQVLVVDDDHNAVKYLSALLSEHGYEPVAAYDGAEGLKRIRQARPDLIILDVMMPKKSGFVLFKQLKQDTSYQEIPILMVTGVAGMLEEMENDQSTKFEKPYDTLRESLRRKIAEMRDEGLIKPDMFFDKPIDPESFIAKIRDLLGS
jgi:two-component system alkaline phosphatase synthesis response regulator PhoP